MGQAGGGYWVQEGIGGGGSGLQQYAEKPSKNRCGFDSSRLCSKEEQEQEEEAASRRRMVELMLGPCNYLYSNVQQAPPTLDLLNAPLLLHQSSSLPLPSIDSTPIELEPHSPLPSGWEKCLDLKTGSIYYLNRSTGSNSSMDPRKAFMCHGKPGRADLNSRPASPTTSEVTMEATMKSNAKQVDLNLTEKHGGDEGALDLNLSLYVGQSPSKSPPHHVSVSAIACPSSHFKAPSSVPCASSSSSSTTSSPINSSFPFSHSSMSSKEPRPSPSQGINNSINKQDSHHCSWLASKESPFCGGFTNADHPILDHSLQNVEAPRLSECHEHGASNAPMVTVACANCLMFVMLSRSNPKCPRCGTCPDQLDFLQLPHKRAKLGFSF